MKKRRERADRVTLWWVTRTQGQKKLTIAVLSILLAVCVFATVRFYLIDSVPEPESNSLESIPILEVLDKPEIDRQILYDGDELCIIADNIVEDPRLGLGIKLELHNKSDKNAAIRTTRFTANGVMGMEGYAINLKPGAETEDIAFFNAKVMEYAGLRTVTVCEIGFSVMFTDQDGSFYSLDIPAKQMYTTNRNAEQSIDLDGLTTAYDRDGIKVSIQRVLSSADFDYNLILIVENNTTDTVSIEANQFRTSGTIMSGTTHRTVLSKCMSIDAIRVPQRALINDDESITATFTLFDSQHNKISDIEAKV